MDKDTVQKTTLAGRREVVEWIQSHQINQYLTPDSHKIAEVQMDSWDRQLVVWGIKRDCANCNYYAHSYYCDIRCQQEGRPG